MARPFWLIAGISAVALGTIGIALPLLPTVPFYLLAAFCFARANRIWEQRLLAHPKWGPPLQQWRARRAISRRAKLSALTAMAASSALSLALLSWPWSMVPALACLASGAWIWTRAE